MLNNELLNNELKENPFAVPDKYFDSLPSRVQDRCIMSKKSPFVLGLVPKLAWSGGIMVLALFLSYFIYNTSIKEQGSETLIVDGNSENVAKESLDSSKNYLKSRRGAMVEYLVGRNVSLNDYLASRY
ncbi:MAG: hypothetical protein LBS55_05805 [Prevotellaceae bacterium]|jgi:hypothetical protein|nr:hypothetical protein [Prevotellaceae bacterium]